MKIARACITCCASGVKPAERLPDQDLHHVVRQAGRLGEQLRQGRVPVGRQDRGQRLQGPRVTARPLPCLAEQVVGSRFQAQPPVGVPGPQHLLGVRRAQPLVQVEAALPLRLREQQRTGGDPRRHDDLDAVHRGVKHRPQRLVQRRVGDREAVLGGVDEVFRLIEEHDHGPGRDGVEQPAHQGGGRLLRVPVAPQEAVGLVLREQPAQVGEQVREVHRMLARRAEVDDPVDVKLTEVIGQPAALERLEQPADHRGLAYAAAPDDRHDPLVGGSQEVPGQLGLDVPVLEVQGRGGGRRVHELRPARRRTRGPLRMPLLVEPGRDPLLGAPGGAFGVGDQHSLSGDPLGQVRDVLLDARSLPGICPRQLPFRLGQLIAQLAKHPLRAAHRIQVIAQPREPDVESAAEVDVLPRRKPERKVRARVRAQGNDRLLVFQRPGPFGFAHRMLLHAVGGHEEKQAKAVLDGVGDLRVPVSARLRVPHVQPHRIGRLPADELVGQPPREPRAVGPRVTDEIVPVHPGTS